MAEREIVQWTAEELYDAGNGRFHPPPVCHLQWTKEDWVRYVGHHFVWAVGLPSAGVRTPCMEGRYLTWAEADLVAREASGGMGAPLYEAFELRVTPSDRADV